MTLKCSVGCVTLFIIIFPNTEQTVEKGNKTLLQFTPFIITELCLYPYPVHLLNLARFGSARIGQRGILPVKCGDGKCPVDPPGRPEVSDIAVGPGDLPVSA